MTTSSWPILPPGLWTRFPELPPNWAGYGALFLDRDGVIIEDRKYLSDPRGVRLVSGAGALIRRANNCGVPVVVVTNQSGIDRGLYDWNAFAAIEVEIARQLADQGATTDATIACPFHPDFTPGYTSVHEHYRKPGPGMIELACERMGLEASASWIVGDRRRDCRAGLAAGLAGAILLGSSPDAGNEPSRHEWEGFRLEQCGGLELADRLLQTLLFVPAKSRSPRVSDRPGE